MAAAFSPIVSSAAAVPPNSNPRVRPTPGQRSTTWWAPIFGWPSDPTSYILNDKSQIGSDQVGQMECERRKKQYRGNLTEEKAKELRRKTAETSNFHDVMYHSAIASRLASDLSGRL